MASAPYPFTANPSANASSSRPPVQYSHLQQPQGQTANSAPATMAAGQHGFYAQSPSNSPSTASLLPPSARGPSAVQATFAQGPRPSLRNIPSNSDIVRSYVIYQVVELEIGNRLGVHLSYSMRRPIARVQHLKLLLFQASQYQTRQVLLISIEREAGIRCRRFLRLVIAFRQRLCCYSTH